VRSRDGPAALSRGGRLGQASIQRDEGRITVSFGSPVDYTDLLAMPRTRETAQAVIDRVMAAIRVQHAELRRRRKLNVAAADQKGQAPGHP
jgi:hypothetical protein